MIGVNHLYSTLWKTKRDYQTQKRQVVTESVEKHSKRQENDAVTQKKYFWSISKPLPDLH